MFPAAPGSAERRTDAERRMRGDQVADAGIAGENLDAREEDQQRYAGDDLGHHQRLVDRGVFEGQARIGRRARVASAAMVAKMVDSTAATAPIWNERSVASITCTFCHADWNHRIEKRPIQMSSSPR